MNLIEIWHYHRPALAKIYLDTLNAGLVTTTTIFAPRRAGKTSFLLKDLTAPLQIISKTRDTEFLAYVSCITQIAH